jgi:hypothetical protein
MIFFEKKTLASIMVILQKPLAIMGINNDFCRITVVDFFFNGTIANGFMVITVGVAIYIFLNAVDFLCLAQ